MAPASEDHLPAGQTRTAHCVIRADRLSYQSACTTNKPRRCVVHPPFPTLRLLSSTSLNEGHGWTQEKGRTAKTTTPRAVEVAAEQVSWAHVAHDCSMQGLLQNFGAGAEVKSDMCHLWRARAPTRVGGPALGAGSAGLHACQRVPVHLPKRSSEPYLNC